MGTTQYALPQERPKQDYWFLNPEDLSKIATEVRGISIDQLVSTNPLGNRFRADVNALTTASSAEDYRGLERRLTDHVLNYKSGESYGSVGRHRKGDVVVATLEYIELLQQIFRTSVPIIDPAYVEKLQMAVIRTAIETIKGVGGLLPKRYKRLYDRAEAEISQRRSKTAQIRAQELA